MPIVVTVRDAETRFSELLARVEQGEDVVIARAGKPVAHLVLMEEPPARRFGVMDLYVPDSTSEPLPASELAAWE